MIKISLEIRPLGVFGVEFGGSLVTNMSGIAETVRVEDHGKLPPRMCGVWRLFDKTVSCAYDFGDGRISSVQVNRGNVGQLQTFGLRTIGSDANCGNDADDS